MAESLLEEDVRKEGEQALQQLQEAIRKREYWQRDSFVKAIPFKYEFKGSGTTGYVIVDEANGMYPLVLDSRTHARLNAYEKALADVLTLYEKEVYPLLKGRTVNDWDQAFQKEVSGIPWNYAGEEQAVSAIGA